MLKILYQVLTSKEQTLLTAIFNKLNRFDVEYVKVTDDFDDTSIRGANVDSILVIDPGNENSVFHKRTACLAEADYRIIPRPFEGLMTKEKREESLSILRQYRNSKTMQTILAEHIPNLTIDSITKLMNTDKIFQVSSGKKNIVVVPNDYDGKPYEDSITVNELILMYMIKYTFNIREIVMERKDE